MEYKLNLLGNSIDSLEESLRQLNLGEITNVNLKFSILLFAHFVELMQAHLIYLETCDKNFKNPGFSAGTKILEKHPQHPMPKQLASNIHRLRDQRNRIQHDAFNYKTFEARELICDIVPSLNEYCRNFEIEPSKLISKEYALLYTKLSDKKTSKLAITQDKAISLSESGVAYGCVTCKENRVAAFIADVIVCQNCGDVTIPT